MLWNPEKPCASTIGYGLCVGGGVVVGCGQFVSPRGVPALPPVPGGVGSDAVCPLQPATVRNPATRAFASTRFMAVRPPVRHLRALDYPCQLPELIGVFARCVNYMSYQETQ